MKSIIIIRPYFQKIRTQVFSLLTELGYPIEQGLLFPKGTPDQEIIQQLPKQCPTAILIPFHTHADTQGNTVDGLSLLLRIREERPEYANCLAIMPVSQVAQGAYSLRAKQLGVTDLPAYAFVRESELEQTETLLARLRKQGF